MILIGIVLIVLGYITPIAFLSYIGYLLLVVGLILLILGAVGRPVGGRNYWF